MSGNFQEDFQFLLKNLNYRNDNVLSKAEQKENINRTKRALINVFNIYITDFDKQYDSVLTPLFHMIELYVQQYTELFILNSGEEASNEPQTIEKEFTNFFISRMLLILSNPDSKSWHSYSCKILIILLEKFSSNNKQIEFFTLITELILTLHDLNQFDKEFYDKNDMNPKVLNRFTMQSVVNQPQEIGEDFVDGNNLAITKKPIIIESPTYCSHLQENITLILREVCFQFINVIHDDLYEKLWTVLCEQLKWGEKSVKIVIAYTISYSLILSIVDIRIIPLNRFDISKENYFYFIDNLFATFELLCVDEKNEITLENEDKSVEENRSLANLASLIANRLFNNHRVFIECLGDVDLFLIRLVDIVKRMTSASLDSCSTQLTDALFSMIYNLIELKLQSNECKYLDVCLLNDLAESLVDFIGRINRINTFVNLIIAKSLICEIEVQNANSNSNVPKKGEPSKESQQRPTTLDLATFNNQEIFRIDLSYERIQTKLYKTLLNRARELLQTLKTLSPSTQEKDFKIKSNGLNSILEILSFACVMSQNDPLIIEEYKNPLIEYAKASLFSINLPPVGQVDSASSTESIYLNLLLFWVPFLNDPRNLSSIHLIFLHALDTIKTIYLSSIEWKRAIGQNLVCFLSIPWLSTETNGLDLELFKDKNYKQCSSNLISQNTTITSPPNNASSLLKQIKLECIQLLALLPKNICPQWRSHLVGRCVRDDEDTDVRQCALKYLPYLISSLGVAGNVLVHQLVHPAMQDEKSPRVLRSYASMLHILCCLVSRKSILVRKSSFDSSHYIDDSTSTQFNCSGDIYRPEMSEYFDIICTCCDKTQIDMQLLPKITRRKNIDSINALYNRPKKVGPEILIQFFLVLNGTKGALAAAIGTAHQTKESTAQQQQQHNKEAVNHEAAPFVEIRSLLLKNLHRVFNHIEFARKLDAHMLTSVVDNVDSDFLLTGSAAASMINAATLSSASSNANGGANTNAVNSTYIFRETMNLLADETLDSITRFDFSRLSISKLISHFNLTGHLQGGSNIHQSSSDTNLAIKRSGDRQQLTLPQPLIMDEDTSKAMQHSVYSHADIQLNHNFNLENQLCEGFLNARQSKSLINMYLFIIGLGRFALSLTHEYVFVCVKHLFEIIDSNQQEDDDWALLARSLAQRQLIAISKKINMKAILDEFEEEVCEILADTIFNTITRSTAKKSSGHSYLQEANQALKSVLKVFNCADSITFVRQYQRYLVPFLTYRATIEGTNSKTITRSLELLARKMYSNSNVSKLIEDNFIYILAYTTIHSNALVVQVFRYITDETDLDIDKLVNFNKQRTLSELLTKCGNPRYKPQIWQAIGALTAIDDEEARLYATKTVEDSRIIKAIEPSLLAVLVYFDLILIKSTFNIKEKCLALESLNLLMALLGPQVITKVRHKLMTTLKLAMQQCSKLSELNCKLWDTFLRNVEKSAIGPVLNQISVNLLQLLDSQPYKVGKIFEYLINQNKEYLHAYFNELYFIPDTYACLQDVNNTLRKYTDTKFIFDQATTFMTQQQSSHADLNAVNLRALIYSIKQYIRGSQHENADLRVKALEKLYALFKEKNAQIIYMIERQENCQIVSEIVIALLNGCRDSDPRAKLLFGSCLGEIGAIDPAYIMATSGSSALLSSSSSAAANTTVNASFSSTSNTSIQAASKKTSATPITPQVLNQSNQSASTSVLTSPNPMMSSNDLLMNASLVSEDSNEFSENFAHSLIVELSKAYLAASNTHEQDSASYAIQECLKIYGCSLSSSSTSGKQHIANIKLWNSFPDYYKEILIPLQTSKYEIHSYDNLGALKTPIILNESSTYEEWVYKWCAYLISKIGTLYSTNEAFAVGQGGEIIDLTGSNSSTSANSSTDKELRVFPKLQFITRFNVNVAFFILPYVIIKMIIQSSRNNNEIIEQIFEEIMSVIQLRMLIEKKNSSPNKQMLVQTSSMKSSHKKILQYHHICCQTIFNIYDHLIRQLNYYRTKVNELQALVGSKSRTTANSKQTSSVIIMGSSARQMSTNEILLNKYRDLFDAFQRFIQRIPQQTISKAAFECKAYCRSLMHYELYMKQTPGAVSIQASTINIKQEHLVELQNLYASMDEIDAASGILVLKKGSEESLADAAFRHKINGRLNESIACIEQMLESNDVAKSDIKQHENYVRSFISIGRYRNALSYLQGLMVDKPEWKEALDSYRIETCWKLGSWDKLKQIISSNNGNRYKPNLAPDLESPTSRSTKNAVATSNKDLINKSFPFDSTLIMLDDGSSKDHLYLHNSFNAGIGKLFSLVTERNEAEFQETLSILREQQLGPLSAASLEAGGNSYQRGYEYVVNLQALQEIESGLSQMLRLSNDQTEKEQYRSLLLKNLDSYLIEPWEHRVQTMQPAFKHLEPIYNVRIALLNFLSSHLDINLSKPMCKLWLRLAKIARKAGMFENSYQYMLNAQGLIKSNDSNNLEELLVEKSKWYWQREDKDSALFYLQKGLNELFNSANDSANSSSNYTLNNELYSKVLLMYTKYSEENGSIDSETLRKNYQEVQKMRKNSEQAHFELAQFTDRLATSVSENLGKKEKFWEYINEVVSYYASSLEHGCQYIYQSLPRMITLWLDFGADYFDHACRDSTATSNSRSSNIGMSSNTSRNLNQLNTILTKLNSSISNALQKIPTYAFLTVYPQLVSRICHPEDRVFETLSNILMKVLFLYPCQAIWMLIAVKNSSVELRKQRCKVIMDKVIRQQPDLRKFIADSSELAEKLVQLGNMNVDGNVSQLSLASYFRPLKKLVESRDFSKILIPSQFQVTLQLPSNDSGGMNNLTNSSSLGVGNNQNQNFRTHNPYPLELVYISCFEDNIQVMSSLQKPKKVTIRGTDGKLYAFLCKAKDDLRIDYRIMEFFSVVNKCLKQEPEARRRNLYIRTYAVTPLNENSGIIEWIENLSTLRSILQKLYAERGVNSIGSSEWKIHEDKVIKDKDYALKVFKQFLDRYRPTVLYEWFVRTFPEPNSWYNARLNYVRTAAVMSVCGYVLGLGDRHCENILMASSNGDCIHVDFNCLFNKGETLGVPEIVPFRLTHNMIEAMGPLGHEGIFRKICEVSLKILRDYRDPLITILKTFIYDPLVEWKTPASYRTNESGETISAKGQLHLQNITCRLKGMHTKTWVTANSRVKALPLSVEGHVSTLIKEASDDRNLSQMYIGWSAYF